MVRFTFTNATQASVWRMEQAGQDWSQGALGGHPGQGAAGCGLRKMGGRRETEEPRSWDLVTGSMNKRWKSGQLPGCDCSYSD